MTITPVPRRVRRTSDRLREAVGDTPTITEHDGRVFMVSLANQRVTYTVTFRPNGRGACRESSRTLTIDGEQVPLPRNNTHLGRIFGTPDLGVPAPNGEAPPPAAPPRCDVGSAPPVVQQAYYALTSVCARRDVDISDSLTVGRDGREWAITFTTGDKSGLRFCLPAAAAGTGSSILRSPCASYAMAMTSPTGPWAISAGRSACS